MIGLFLAKVNFIFRTLNFMRWLALRGHQMMNMDFVWYEQVPTDINFQIAPLTTCLPVLLLSRFPFTPLKLSLAVSKHLCFLMYQSRILLCAGCIFVTGYSCKHYTNYVMWLVWTEGMQCCITKLWCSILHATTHCLQLDLKPKLVVVPTLNLLSAFLWHSSWYAGP